MTFLDQVKADMGDYRKRAGLHGNALVNARALQELIDDYERMDSANRVSHNSKSAPPYQILVEAITAPYREQGKNSERVLEIIMETLLPLIQQKRMEIEMEVMWGGYSQ